ncbi:twitching motility protein PilT [Geminocystis sp. NIES-3708]|uniref:type IV pilus twitching motility protein PilT n=1 Tax=Geminocystis sp. NIES-3708 TaxID=1615909 RepID=UPI0005FC3D51|nr:type IV pilus twitching motility protein PilT [Geminocystis sp. NIES-3708]BAQ62765.1 twitching motility protein PilT [Geminocystis sp. NIES-3708]
MTQSSDRQRKQPLPVPPLISQTKPQGITNIEDKTNINPDDSVISLGKNTNSLQPFNIPDLDDDDFDSEEKTQINTPGMLPPLNNQGKFPPLSPPPLSSSPRSPLNNKNIQSKAQNNTPVGGIPPLNSSSAPPRMTAKPGETDVRKGSVMDRSPAPASLRAGPQGAARSSTPPVGRAPGQPSLHELVQIAYDNGYSDVHLGVGEFPRMRDRGEMMILEEYPEIDLNTFMSWLREILRDDEIQRFKKELEFDGATQYDFARVRINVFDTLRGPALVLRLIPLKILTLEQLRLPPIFRDICDAHKGLILVTGPTGSGKSTTLAAMVDHINSEHAKHIITIEDPVEFVHKSRKSLIKQREVGMHTLKFDNALKASLREDPDIILVGEMRDKETVNTALKAAQTGHLVMGTLHTNSAVKTLERIFTLYTAEEQPAMRSAIAESLVGIIAQGLCRTTDGKRAAYHDILINTETVKDYILSNKYEEIGMLMAEGEFDGMITMNKSLFELYQEGRITEETALERSPTRNEMAMMLRGRV